MPLIVLNVSRPVIIKQPVCLYSEVSQQGSSSAQESRQTPGTSISRQNWSGGDGAGDRLSPGHIMSPPAPNMSLVKVMSHYKQSHCFHHRADIKTQVVEREGAGCRGMCSIYD